MQFQPCFGLAILVIINTINFLDRLSIPPVLTEIKKFYDFSGTQSGLLSTCFLLGYMLTSPVFGYLGDKYSRKWILVGGILFWCVAAFSGSIISKAYYPLFFLSRILVGVGEACYSTIAPTIIADLFGPDTRKIALSIFYFAIPIGSGLGFLMGNLALSLGDWRYIFWITPAIGLLSTGLLLILEEPVRGQSDGASVQEADNSTIMENIRYLAGIKSYVWATIGFTCCLFAMGALSWWGINFFGVAVGEQYEKEATIIFGIIVCLAGFCGVSIGSSAAKYLRNYDGRADPFVCAAGVFIAVPFTFFGLVFARSQTSLSWVCLFLSVTALSTNWAVVSDMLLSVTLPTKRAFATSIQILLSHLFGDATSPFITGFLRDTIKGDSKDPDDDYLAFLYSLLSTLILLTLGAVAFLYSAKYFVQDVEAYKQRLSKRAVSDETTRSDAANLTDFAAMP
uniref:Protein spinster 1 n=1 Tax=Aceria tosichella TaxID=561515 RepID=A0A6G1SAZ0_9ACAR